MVFFFAFLFFIQSEESIYDPRRFGLILINEMKFTIQINNREINYLPSIDSKLLWYLFSSESKTYFITSSASSSTMISMLSLF